jgi:monothiol glutaredoxin
MYMKVHRPPQCRFSAATTEILRTRQAVHTVDVLSSPEKRDAIKRFSNWPTIPQVYVNGTFIGGCDIVRELHQRGDLQRTLSA